MITKLTVRQIIEDINRRYPNTYSDKDKIAWINDTMRQIYNDIAVKEFYSFYTKKGQRVYTLPEDCSMRDIKSVEISEKAKKDSEDNLGRFFELHFALRDKDMFAHSFYDAMNGMIGLYPEPKESGHKVNIYYAKRPKMITSLDDYIQLDDQYTDLVKYNVISIIAMSGHNPDTEVANEYILLYNNLVAAANQAKFEQQPQYPVVKDAMRPLLKHRRRR